MDTKTLFDLDNLSVKELLTTLENTTSVNASAAIHIILILLDRMNSSIEDLQRKSEELQQGQSASTHGRRGRKRKDFYLGKTLIDDDYLIYLVDKGFYTLKQLEEEVGAGKNQLRNRYRRAKKR